MNERLRELYTQKHRADANYGKTHPRHITPVRRLIDRRMWASILDYGCGKAVLSEQIPGIVNYDFAIPEYSTLPTSHFDVALCIDVVEHIPESDLPETMEYFKEHVRNVYFCIHLGNSLHKLPNGESCHCTVRPANWWIRYLSRYWNSIELISVNTLHLTVIVS